MQRQRGMTLKPTHKKQAVRFSITFAYAATTLSFSSIKIRCFGSFLQPKLFLAICNKHGCGKLGMNFSRLHKLNCIWVTDSQDFYIKLDCFWCDFEMYLLGIWYCFDIELNKGVILLNSCLILLAHKFGKKKHYIREYIAEWE